MTEREPIAVVGIGSLFPGVAGPESFWRSLTGADPRFAPFPADRVWRTDPAVRRRLEAWHGSFFKELRFDLQRFRIPPAYAKAVPQTTLMLLQVAQECVRDAGCDDKPLPRDDVDVVVGTCFGFDSTLANALKVEGVQFAHLMAQAEGAPSGAVFESACERLKERFGVSSHDRVGEMASSMPARIASFLGLRGRIQAIENADATGFSVVEAAVCSLAGGQCRAVIAATGQRFENALVPLALERKGFSGAPEGHPFSGAPVGVPVGEGAIALLLMRLGDAERDGRRIYSVIRGLSASRRDAAEPFKYVTDPDARRKVVAEACAEAGVAASGQAYIDCVLPGMAQEADALRQVLEDQDPVSGGDVTCFGSSVACFGHTFANSILTALAATSLAVHHATLPPLARAKGQSLALPEERLADGAPRPWPAAAGGRIAGLSGSSLTGMNWHIVLSDPAAPLGARRDRRPSSASSGVGAAGRNAAAHVPIAVVGMGGAFGPSASRDAFWRDLHDGRDGVQPLNDALLPRSPYFSPMPKALSTYAQFGAALGSHDFSLSGYKLFPKRAAALDTAQKLMLQVAAEALADYGFRSDREPTGKAAIIVASSLALGRERVLACRLHHEELRLALGSALDAVAGPPGQDGVDHLTLDGCLASATAALISSAFGLQAATMAVEAACASSLAALHHAVLALRQHRYDFILAGGVELPVNIRDLVLCSSQMMLSRERIAPFAEGADGFSPGDGAGMFVLKRLDDAVRDGDTVHACITGIGGSSDANSMTAPDADGQVLAMRRAFEQAGYAPATVQYVEAHGTGTKIGDLVEISSLGRVYGENGRSPLRIGSVKSNFGHTFAAAGSAGLLKTLLAMRHGVLPKTLMRRQINPELPLASVPAEIVVETQPWDAVGGIRRAAVNSMGTGGINYHLLLEARALPGPEHVET